jgi:Fe-S-cluster containining protein
VRYGGPTGIGELVEKLAMVRDEAGRFVCTQFDGPIGGPCSCRIYEERPQPCRRLEVGSDACRDARRRAGFPA